MELRYGNGTTTHLSTEEDTLLCMIGGTKNDHTY